jgi:hypothetical protein
VGGRWDWGRHADVAAAPEAPHGRDASRCWRAATRTKQQPQHPMPGMPMILAVIATVIGTIPAEIEGLLSAHIVGSGLFAYMWVGSGRVAGMTARWMEHPCSEGSGDEQKARAKAECSGV